MAVATTIACIVFLIVVIAIPRALWKQRVEDTGGIVLWAFATCAVIVFAVVVFVAEVSALAPHA